MKRNVLWAAVALVVILSPSLEAQSVRSLVNRGNDLYREGKYADAEVNYRKALEKEKSSMPGKFNLGNALHKEGKLDEAVREYENTLQPGMPAGTKAKVYYNIGNSYLRAQKYQEAVRSYVESLKLVPDDYDAKYNLSYALERLRQQQQNKDQNKQDQKKKDQQQNQQQQQQKQDQQQQKKQQQEKQISKTDAQRILDVLKNSERDVQKKLRARPAARPRTDKDW